MEPAKARIDCVPSGGAAFFVRRGRNQTGVKRNQARAK
jgi:hypothetical protein